MPTPWLTVLDALGSAASLQLASPLLSLMPRPPQNRHASVAVPLASVPFMQASTQGQGGLVQGTEVQVQ